MMEDHSLYLTQDSEIMHLNEKKKMTIKKQTKEKVVQDVERRDITRIAIVKFIRTRND